MKKKGQLSIIITQSIITAFLLFYILISIVDSFRFFSSNYMLNLKALSDLLQLFCYLYLSLKIYQMNEPRRQTFTINFLLVLLNLSIDAFIVITTRYNTFNYVYFSPIFIGKLHIFTLLNSVLFLILCGINQNGSNTKNLNYEISITFLLSFALSYIFPVNSPTIENPSLMINTSPYFKMLFVLLIVIAIFSYIPSYIQDKTTHNRLKTLSFILFTISIGILNFSLNTNFILGIIALFTLSFSSIYLIINLKSYSI